MGDPRRGEVILVRFPFTDLRIKGEKLAMVHRSVIHSTIGSLQPTVLDAVSQRVKTALRLS